MSLFKHVVIVVTEDSDQEVYSFEHEAEAVSFAKNAACERPGHLAYQGVLHSEYVLVPVRKDVV